LEPGLAAPAIGARVRVPFSGRERVGVVLGCVDRSELADDQLKPLSAILDAQPLLTPELVATLEWASRYYQHAIGEVFDAALPGLLRRGRELPPGGIPAVALTAQGREGLAAARPARATRIGSLLELLGGGALAVGDLDQRLPGWRSSARTLKHRGWLEDCRLQALPIPAEAIAAPVLNDEQRAAVDAVSGRMGAFAAFLLDGVTGSGKTEVYLASIAEAIRLGRQALVLVP